MPKFRPLSETKFINDANLVSYWKLEDLTDSKGSNTLTNNGSTTFVAGKFNNCANFVSSSSQYLYRTGITDLPSGSNARTISFWFNGTLSSPSKWLFAYGTRTLYKDLSIYNHNSGKLAIAISGEAQEINYTFSDNTWYYISITLPGSSSKTFTVYVNGLLNGTVTFTNAINTVNSFFSIGAYYGGTLFGFDGKIDDFAIFSRALSASEVNELYQGMTLGEYLPNSSTKLLLHLNGNSTDSSGNGNNGTVSGATVVDGKFGKCYSFDGSDDGIEFADNFKFTTDFTISAWIKPSANNKNNIFSSYRYDGNSYGYWFDIAETSQKLQFAIFGGSGVDIRLLSPSVIPTGSWLHVVAVRTASTGSRLYINGALVASDTNATNPSYSTQTWPSLGIRRYNSSAGQVEAPFNGPIDEVVIENVAWSAEKVKKYYTYAKGRFGII